VVHVDVRQSWVAGQAYDPSLRERLDSSAVPALR
jgi:hypothetical protein